jgi:hypothetical protein
MADAAEKLRPAEEADAVTSTAALRWVARRKALVTTAILAVVGLFPGLLLNVRTIVDLRKRLDTDQALMALREKAVSHLSSLPPPLGFGRRARPRRRSGRACQHDMGDEPPERLQYSVEHALRGGAQPRRNG